MKFYFYLLFGCISIFNLAQNTNEELKKKELNEVQTIKDKYRNFDDKIERNTYDNHFKAIEHHVKRGYEKDLFIVDKDYTDFFKKMFNQFNQNSKNINLPPAHFFIEKSNIPNASSSGFDYYTLYSGLFNSLDNEYQLAAVISHEIAHNYLNHTRQEIVKEAEFIKDFKQEFRSIKKSELIKLIKSQDKVIQLKYDLANQSRKKEIAADSLGFILYESLNYPKNEYLKLLNKLESFDDDNKIQLKDSTYYKLFEVENVKINPKWLKIEKDDLFAGLNFTEHFDEDSIKSHPNIKDRIDWISNHFKFDKNDTIKINGSKEFLALKEKEINNFYQNFYINNEYGLALYYLMNEKQQNSTRNDLDKNLGIVLTKLHEGRLKHEFNKYVKISDPNAKNQNYQIFLNFVWNLSTPDIKSFADYYTKKATL